MSGITSSELTELRQVVRSFLDTRSPESEVRRLMETGEGFDRGVWNEMASGIGLQGLVVPSEFGGFDATFVELAAVLEEMGRSLLCAPFLATSLATAALMSCGDDAARST